MDHRLVITAAHCLPHLPPPLSISLLHERKDASLLGTLDAAKPEVWAECLFADPVADIAVLGGPDDQELHDAAEAYEALTGGVRPFLIGKAPREGQAWVLTLDGKRSQCDVKFDRWICINKTTEIKGGMSGSTILADGGKATGVVCTSWESISPDGVRRGEHSFPNPALAHHLPGWVLRNLWAR